MVLAQNVRIIQGNELLLLALLISAKVTKSWELMGHAKNVHYIHIRRMVRPVGMMFALTTQFY